MEISVQFLILIPVVLGLVQAFKIMGLKKKMVPITSVVIAVLGAIFLVGSLNKVSILQGIIAGLSACGLWSGTKTVVE